MPNFKSVDEKIPELELQVPHSFLHENNLEKKAFKSFGPPSSPLLVKIFCSKSRSPFNLILAISFGFKLNRLTLIWTLYLIISFIHTSLNGNEIEKLQFM